MAAPQTCVVCGTSSARPVWNNSGSVNGIAYVACDFHTLHSIVFSALNPTVAVPGIRKHPTTLSVGPRD